MYFKSNEEMYLFFTFREEKQYGCLSLVVNYRRGDFLVTFLYSHMFYATKQTRKYMSLKYVNR